MASGRTRELEAVGAPVTLGPLPDDVVDDDSVVLGGELERRSPSPGRGRRDASSSRG